MLTGAGQVAHECEGRVQGKLMGAGCAKLLAPVTLTASSSAG